MCKFDGAKVSVGQSTVQVVIYPANWSVSLCALRFLTPHLPNWGTKWLKYMSAHFPFQVGQYCQFTVHCSTISCSVSTPRSFGLYQFRLVTAFVRYTITLSGYNDLFRFFIWLWTRVRFRVVSHFQVQTSAHTDKTIHSAITLDNSIMCTLTYLRILRPANQVWAGS